MTPIIPDAKKKRYPGHYPGQVVSVSDPEGLMRVRVRVHPLFEDLAEPDLPWAEYLLPLGARPGNGIFVPAKVDDWVWVDFPYLGDSRRPRIVGAMHYCPGSAPNLPHDAWEGPGAPYPHARTANEPIVSPPAYHDGSIVVDQNGALLEVDADSAIRVTHKASGSAIEICPDGKITVHGASEVNITAGTNANIIASSSATVQAPAISLIGQVAVQGNLTATGSIIDTSGNTNHHTH